MAEALYAVVEEATGWVVATAMWNPITNPGWQQAPGYVAIEAPPGVEARWTYADGVFVPPPPEVFPRLIETLAFRKRFTTLERGAITLAASQALDAGDPTLQVFLDDLSASQEVDLNDPAVSAALDMLTALNLIADGRKAEILA